MLAHGAFLRWPPWLAAGLGEANQPEECAISLFHTNRATTTRGMSLSRSLDRVVGRVLLASIATGVLTLAWWPELNTVRVILPAGFSLIGATLGRIAARSDYNVALAAGSAVAAAVLFAFLASDVLGVGNYGTAPVLYGLAAGVPMAILTWTACRLLARNRANPG
jgi:hypothetical protein